MTVFLLAAGLVLLVVGAELLVRGASRLAVAFAVPPLVVGLTVVAFGTSAPELAVSVGAALTGRGGIALGNVVGSNIFNVLLILGLSAVIVPLAVARKLVRLEVPILIGVTVLVVFLAWNGAVGRSEGAVLVALGVAYTVFQVCEGRREGPVPEAGLPSERSARWGRASLLVALGLGLLILGARWLVESAEELARTLGVSELVIGVTVIAAGTSLPEVATSVIASLRGERDIAVGNVIGSNLFNLLWVLGLASALSEGGVPIPAEAWSLDIPVMVAAAVLCLPIFFTGFAISRWEGALLLGYYAAYTVSLLLAATGSASLPAARLAVFGFAALTIAVLAVHLVRSRTRQAR